MLPQANLNLEAILHFRLLGICVCSIGSSKLANIYGLLATELTLVARACAPVCRNLSMPMPVSYTVKMMPAKFAWEWYTLVSGLCGHPSFLLRQILDIAKW